MLKLIFGIALVVAPITARAKLNLAAQLCEHSLAARISDEVRQRLATRPALQLRLAAHERSVVRVEELFKANARRLAELGHVVVVLRERQDEATARSIGYVHRAWKIRGELKEYEDLSLRQDAVLGNLEALKAQVEAFIFHELSTVEPYYGELHEARNAYLDVVRAADRAMNLLDQLPNVEFGPALGILNEKALALEMIARPVTLAGQTLAESRSDIKALRDEADRALLGLQGNMNQIVGLFGQILAPAGAEKVP